MRMLKVMQSTLVSLCSYLIHHQAKLTSIGFINSTKLQVCYNLRIPRYRMFEGVAKRGLYQKSRAL